MHVMDTGVLFGPSTAEASLKWNVNGPIQAVNASSCIGAHGEEYSAEKSAPANYVAILNCGCQRNFPVPPVTGELLYCRRHDDWFKCRVPGGYILECRTCPFTVTDLGHHTALAYRKARNHSVGSRNQRVIKHTVFIGRYTENSIDWREYAAKNSKEN